MTRRRAPASGGFRRLGSRIVPVDGGYSHRVPSATALVANQFRVGMLAPISWRVPPRRYGPCEQFVSLLTEGLVGRGVEGWLR